MSKQRDSGTGQYINETKARALPRNTWTKETSKPIKQRNSKLGTVYRKLNEKVQNITYTTKSGEIVSLGPAVTLVDINKIFEDAGLQLPNG